MGQKKSEIGLMQRTMAARWRLVCDFEVLAPGDIVGDENVDAVEAGGEIGERDSPGALRRLATSDRELFGFSGSDQMVIEVVKLDGGGGLDVLNVGEGDDGDSGSVASLEAGLPVVLNRGVLLGVGGGPVAEQSEVNDL